MSFSDQTLRNDYTAGGSATDFNFDFPLHSENDLIVLSDGVQQTKGVHYNVRSGLVPFNNLTQSQLPATGFVRFVSTPASGVVVSLVPQQAFIQTSDYTTEPFPPFRVETDFDKLVMICRTLREGLARALKFATKSITTPGNVDDSIPGKFLRAKNPGPGYDWADPPSSVSIGVTLPLSIAEGGTGEITAPAARTALGAASTSHKDTHKSGGTDAFVSTDILDATVTRLQESGGATLTMGAIATSQVFQRSGTSIVGTSLTGISSGAMMVRGLVGVNNATVPNTLYEWTAEFVTLMNSTLQSPNIHVYNQATLRSNAVNGTGPAAGFRDQVAAFSANSWVHFYYIWNGTTLSTISSTKAPPLSPTLPSGYTHWAYVGAVRFNASSQLVRTYMRGDTMYYQNRQIALENATSGEQTVNVAAFVPPNAKSFLAKLDTDDSGPAQTRSLRIVTGVDFIGDEQNSQVQFSTEVPNTNQSIIVQDSVGAAKRLRIYGYRVGNGG